MNIIVYIGAMMTLSCTVPAYATDDNKEPETPISQAPPKTIDMDHYFPLPKVQKFSPHQSSDSICYFNEDSTASLEKTIELCLASKQNWLRL